MQQINRAGLVLRQRERSGGAGEFTELPAQHKSSPAFILL